MSLQHTPLTRVIQPAATETAIYSLPGGGAKAHVKGLLLHCTSEDAQHVSVFWVAAGGSATTANRILSVDLEADETLTFEVPYSLILTEEGESIHAITTTAGGVNVCILGDIDQ